MTALELLLAVSLVVLLIVAVSKIWATKLTSGFEARIAKRRCRELARLGKNLESVSADYLVEGFAFKDACCSVGSLKPHKVAQLFDTSTLLWFVNSQITLECYGYLIHQSQWPGIDLNR